MQVQSQAMIGSFQSLMQPKTWFIGNGMWPEFAGDLIGWETGIGGALV